MHIGSRSRIGTRIAVRALRVMVRPRHSAGFSLIELMVTVAIIGIISAAILPSMSDVMADHRAVSASMDVLRLARKARALTLAGGMAYMLHYQKPGGDSLGTIDLVQGMNGRCLQTPWGQALGRPMETIGNGLGMAYYNPVAGGIPKATDAHRHVIVLHAFTTAGTDLAELEICYQPNGEVYFAVPPLQPLARQPNTTLITLSVTRTVDNRPHGESREVIFPAGGSARAH
jgi:prepilin-type N-terminal cleavage/methylation domain-containing protein